MAKAEIVIVGGGLGGVATAQALSKHKKDISVTLINPTDTFLFKPRVYEWLNGKDPLIPMERLFPPGRSPVRFLQGKARRVIRPPEGRFIELEDGRQIPYDYLVLAAGSTTNYFNLQDAAGNTLSLNSYDDIEAIRDSIRHKLEDAVEHLNQPEVVAEDLSFEIIGGGATGIELAMDMKHYIEDEIEEHYPQLEDKEPLIEIVEASDILPGFSEHEKDYVKEALEAEHIHLLSGHRVKSVKPDKLIVEARDATTGMTVEKSIPCTDPIWVAGVKAETDETLAPAVERYPRNDRIKVNEYLELADSPEVYVIGDLAGLVSPESGQLLPPTAQVVEQEAAYVAEDILRKLGIRRKARQPFQYHCKGRMLSLGPANATLYINQPPLQGFMLKGFLASLLRDFYYSFKMRRLGY